MTEQTTVTIAQIVDAIETALSAATGVTHSQTYDELTEGIVDFPLLQVYPDGANQDAVNTSADRTTFRAGVRQTSLVVIADYYAQQRSHIGEDMAQLVAGMDGIIAVLEAQDTKPYFDLAGIKAFTWSMQRVAFVYGSNQASYAGARFTITLRLF